MILLDTHVLVWALNDDRKLGRKSRALIDRNWTAGEVAVSAILFWEAGMLHTRRRLKLPSPAKSWRDEVLAAGVREIPLDGAIAVRALDLEGLPDDPADRFIAATAILNGAALLTADEKMLGWHHNLERRDARV